MPSDIPPSPGAGAGDVPSMEGGGVYIRWEGRLWQEQPDGSYLVWSEESRTWESSTTQPPPQPGETRETKECPNCGKRLKASLRHCPHCGAGFEGRVSAPPRPEAVPVAHPTRQSVSSAAVLVALALLVVAVVGGVLLFQRERACNSWKSAVAEVTDAKIDLEGLPEGATQEELYELNQDLLADQRPGGCE